MKKIVSSRGIKAQNYGPVVRRVSGLIHNVLSMIKNKAKNRKIERKF